MRPSTDSSAKVFVVVASSAIVHQQDPERPPGATRFAPATLHRVGPLDDRREVRSLPVRLDPPHPAVDEVRRVRTERVEDEVERRSRVVPAGPHAFARFAAARSSSSVKGTALKPESSPLWMKIRPFKEPSFRSFAQPRPLAESHSSLPSQVNST